MPIRIVYYVYITWVMYVILFHHIHSTATNNYVLEIISICCMISQWQTKHLQSLWKVSHQKTPARQILHLWTRCYESVKSVALFLRVRNSKNSYRPRSRWPLGQDLKRLYALLFLWALYLSYWLLLSAWVCGWSVVKSVCRCNGL